jgi:hypothetical protein
VAEAVKERRVECGLDDVEQNAREDSDDNAGGDEEDGGELLREGDGGEVCVV